MSQDSVDKKLKEWNDAWFGNKIEMKKARDDIPEFLEKIVYYLRRIISSPVNVSLYTKLLK